MDPSRNSGILPSRTKKYESYIASWAKIYKCAKAISEIRIIEESTVQNATVAATAGLGELSFLEGSISKKTLPSSVSKGNLGLPIFDFLSVIRRSLECWLGEGIYMDLTEVFISLYLSDICPRWY